MTCVLCALGFGLLAGFVLVFLSPLWLIAPCVAVMAWGALIEDRS